MFMRTRTFKDTLRECQAQRAVFEAEYVALRSAVATIEFSPEGLVLQANPLFLNLLGLTWRKSADASTARSAIPPMHRAATTAPSGRACSRVAA